MGVRSAGGGGTVVLAGNVGITAILAGLAIVLSAVTYIANRRRTNEPHLPGHVSLRGKRAVEERHGLHGNSNNKTGGVTGTGGGGSASRQTGGVGGGGGGATTGPKSYCALRAERHVGQYNANLLEWRDDVIGVRMLFSPILFAVETEERQAPLLLVALRYLRQPEHRVAVIIESCVTAATAEEYRDGSLARIRDCVKLLSCGITRIGVTSHPSAEYCYMDAGNNLRYALSVFLTHGNLAVTAQYVADTRVKGVLPTAFNELVRSIQLQSPRPTPSYLLCAEPRLGLGFRLPLDFAMDDQLREALVVSDDSLVKSVGFEGSHGNSNFFNAGHHGVSKLLPAELISSTTSLRHSLGSVEEKTSAGIECGTPFAAVAGCGSRRMVVVACYEPPARGRVLWQLLFERLLRTTLARFSAVQGGGVRDDGEEQGRGTAPISVVWCAGGQELSRKNDKFNTFIVRPQQLVVPINGDGAVDDGASDTLLLDGSFCVQEITLDSRGASFPVLRELLQLQCEEEGEEEDKKEVGGGPRRDEKKKKMVEPTVFSAYLGVFCLRIRDECVSISFLSSATRHTLGEFITFCHRTLDTVSVGNHFGQSTSIIYCNTRHEVMPFSILLEPASAGGTTSVLVEEPIIGDPLALIHVSGLERVKVLLRVFPFPAAPLTSSHSQGRMAKRLEKIVQNYLSQLPDSVCVHHLGTTMLGSRAALEIHYEQMVDDDDSDAGLLALDEEVGHINPFASYWGTSSYSAVGISAAGSAAKSTFSSFAPAGAPTLTSSCSVDPLLLRSSSRDSREEIASMRVAVVLCFEGFGFLFIASSMDYSLNAVRQVVRQLAANVSVGTGVPT
ncbi:Present in the outer mitochondrial membrane proteome 34 [Trypanosoma cruzi]|uniref:Present in the outer mitochondrial membrane proteome 34 n=2 Tax=Trypanosoma cruzi TaxID=5693 RepID=Q4D0J5_TRYCC|nr:hypothetical protein, conserved [Trypanosoma cruzi]EAN86048.1 hypothetical protein, conserved [Trypanosoma cruzi]PWV06346.1 Present in the outer mitochondrial membrane proteome 34 [Trypanosoma cruzi]RNC59378.1 hypothetical protein TcCL_ESM02953 [Trypanosoma cruzi]|eukprot:XP_807899.1 hypothetical protein [Trypanosoma cruzi strain CL Brener]